MNATAQSGWYGWLRGIRLVLFLLLAVVLLQLLCGAARLLAAQDNLLEPHIETISVRGHQQKLHVYGRETARPVIVSSGDGGWIHLGPHVAEVLAARGFYVVGFDVRAYLEDFTTRTTTLRTDDEPRDYKVLIDFAARASGRKPVLIGVSEGAGLSILAATDPANGASVSGVIGLGLSDQTELGWRWKDMTIYLTHRTPDEPTFSVKGIVDRLTPVPLAAIHSTRDEFVPLGEVQEVLDRARHPKRLWMVTAADHRFSDSLPEFDRCLFEAVDWVAGLDAQGRK
jgi:fermentation-respiration switch protein FrsA (DUF1100 family)